MNLDSKVNEIPTVGSYYQTKLNRLGIFTIEDLLKHIPTRYLDFSLISKISKIQPGEVVSITGQMVSLKNIFTRRGSRMQIGSVEDPTDKLTVVWFNQPFLVRSLYPGQKVNLAGKVELFSGKIALISPEYEILGPEGLPVHTQGIVPIYPETKGISSKWIRTKIKNILKSKLKIPDFLPKRVLEENSFPDIVKAYKAVHFPKSNLEPSHAIKRLAFDELLFLQLQSLQRKSNWQKNKSAHKLAVNKKLVEDFIKTLPFVLTKAQVRSVEGILSDFKNPYPMNKLLQGDVGSGKTVVGAVGAFVSFLNGYQTLIMAPTQILAEQHFQTLNKIFKKYKVRISLITSESKQSELGRSDIFIGTHALLSRKLILDKVGLVIIDEQHRFGVEQRTKLAKKVGTKKTAPHVLTMTATPIPRTTALTIYGDLDLSVLDEMPEGRLKVTTWVVPRVKRKSAYEWIQKLVKKERVQAFVVCPLIEESQVETMQTVKSAKKEFEDLKKLLPKLRFGLLHGKLTGKEKTKVLTKFKKRLIDVLVSTPVVEVGIDIPNATLMVIEGAERFGLSQLHQLRGRVGRGDKKSYCLLFTDSKSQTVSIRLKAMTKSHSGFELAELDLKLRGPGEIFGLRQHGIPDLKVASWTDFDLIQKSRSLAEEINKSPSSYPEIIKRVTNLSNPI